MEIQLPPRVGVFALLLGAALVPMSVSVVGAPLALAAEPLMTLIGSHVNPLVLPTATLLACITVGVVLLLLRWAMVRGTTSPGSLLGRNQGLFAAARVVAWVYLAGSVITLAASEIEWFFQVPFFNLTQLNVLSVQGQVFMVVVLSSIGILMLVLLAPRILAACARRAI